MKKIFKQTFVVAAAGMMTIAGACGGGGTENSGNNNVSGVTPRTLNVITIDKGYGTEWLDSLKSMFEKDNPGVTVKIKKEPIDTNITKFLDSGAGNSDYDLYFTGDMLLPHINATLQGDNVLTDLSDIYAIKPDGQTTVAEALGTLHSAYKHEKDGENVYYTLPWSQGINGLLVNYDVVDKALGANWETTYPCRTTEELIDFCDALVAKKVYPFIYAAETQYYQFLYNAWWAQFEGLDGIEDYYNGTAYDPAQGKEVSPSKLIFKQQGRLESIKVMETLMKTKDYVNPVSTGIQWDAMQTRFMAGQAAMLANGDWNNIEMRTAFPKSNVNFIKTPIISALGTKLGITEAELAATISYVDAKLAGEAATAPTLNPTGTYSVEEILAAVEEARCVVSTYADYFVVSIPAWSKHIDLAKDFLRLMVSNEGQEAFAKATLGESTLPFGFDISKTDWYATASKSAKARWEIAKHAKYYYAHSELKLGKGGLMAFRAIYSAPIEHLLYKQGWTAQDVIDVDIEYYEKGAAWSNLLQLAGLA